MPSEESQVAKMSRALPSSSKALKKWSGITWTCTPNFVSTERYWAVKFRSTLNMSLLALVTSNTAKLRKLKKRSKRWISMTCHQMVTELKGYSQCKSTKARRVASFSTSIHSTMSMSKASPRTMTSLKRISESFLSNLEISRIRPSWETEKGSQKVLDSFALVKVELPKKQLNSFKAFKEWTKLLKVEKNLTLISRKFEVSSLPISTLKRQKRRHRELRSFRWTTSNTRSPSCSLASSSKTSLLAPQKRSWRSILRQLVKEEKWLESSWFQEHSRPSSTSKSKINARLRKSLLETFCSRASMLFMSSTAIQRRWDRSEMRSCMTRELKSERRIKPHKPSFRVWMDLKIS